MEGKPKSGVGLARGLPHSCVQSAPFPAGVNQFCQDIVDMIRQCPPWCSQLVPYFKACWVIFTPGMLLVSQAGALRSSCPSPRSSYGESLGSCGVASHPLAILVRSAPFAVHSLLHLPGPVGHHTALRSVPVPPVGPGAGHLHGGAELPSDSALGWHRSLQGVRDAGCCESGKRAQWVAGRAAGREDSPSLTCRTGRAPGVSILCRS